MVVKTPNSSWSDCIRTCKCGGGIHSRGRLGLRTAAQQRSSSSNSSTDDDASSDCCGGRRRRRRLVRPSTEPGRPFRSSGAAVSFPSSEREAYRKHKKKQDNNSPGPTKSAKINKEPVTGSDASDAPALHFLNA